MSRAPKPVYLYITVPLVSVPLKTHHRWYLWTHENAILNVLPTATAFQPFMDDTPSIEVNGVLHFMSRNGVCKRVLSFEFQFIWSVIRSTHLCHKIVGNKLKNDKYVAIVFLILCVERRTPAMVVCSSKVSNINSVSFPRRSYSVSTM